MDRLVKKISHLTPCKLFAIKVPVWNGGNRCVGLADYKLEAHNEVKILYKNKEGDLSYPHSFYISDRQAREYPLEPLKSRPDIQVRMIPIKQLVILERI